MSLLYFYNFPINTKKKFSLINIIISFAQRSFHFASVSTISFLLMSLEISESLLQLRSLHTDLRDAFIKLLRHISYTLPTCCLWVPSRNSCCTIYFCIMMASTTKITPQINPCQSLTASPFNHSFFNQYWYAARYLNKKSDWEPPLTKVAAFDSSSKLSSSHARLLCRGSSDFSGYSSSSIQLRFNPFCHSTSNFANNNYSYSNHVRFNNGVKLLPCCRCASLVSAATQRKKAAATLKFKLNNSSNAHLS